MILKAVRTLFTLGAIWAMFMEFWVAAASLGLCAFIMAMFEDD